MSISRAKISILQTSRFPSLVLPTGLVHSRNISKIEANCWQGGILLHLRGNIQGYVQAGSEFKYLRCITGRHDLPFYYGEEVAVQRSFLDAVLKGEDLEGWTVQESYPLSTCVSALVTLESMFLRKSGKLFLEERSRIGRLLTRSIRNSSWARKTLWAQQIQQGKAWYNTMLWG